MLVVVQTIVSKILLPFHPASIQQLKAQVTLVLLPLRYAQAALLQTMLPLHNVVCVTRLLTELPYS